LTFAARTPTGAFAEQRRLQLFGANINAHFPERVAFVPLPSNYSTDKLFVEDLKRP